MYGISAHELIVLFSVIFILIYLFEQWSAQKDKGLEKGILTLDDMQPEEGMLFMKYEYPDGGHTLVVAMREDIWDDDSHRNFIIGRVGVVFEDSGDKKFHIDGKDSFHYPGYFHEIVNQVEDFWVSSGGA